ncbi:bud site selection protein 31 [Microdochium nivale]|nr:bud site selection protein 31 [Microdochium nivale]
MPAIRTHASRNKKPPAGFDNIRDDLEVFNIKMKDAQNAPTNNVAKSQATWPIFQIAHQRSRYVYELYYEKEAISKSLYDWLLKNGYADAMLIAKWKKQGYEKLCCLRCIQTTETNFQSTCICRVPKAQMKGEGEIQCASCGCRGCASSD